MSGSNLFEQAANLAKSAGLDTSDIIDNVSSHVPGGDAVAQVLKTGLNMATSQESSQDEGEAEVASDDSEQEA